VDLVSNLSPTLWDLLQRTRLRPDLAMELFDDKLIPLFPATSDVRFAALQRATSSTFYAGEETSLRSVLRSGREGRLSIDQWNVMLLPIRDGGQPVAVLAAVTELAGEHSTPEYVEQTPAEAAARAWRDAIEGDLISTRRVRAQEQIAHRAKALGSFVADMQRCEDEAQLLNALLQAIAVWHDIEPCAYNRDLAGQFVLRATLPGTDRGTIPASLEAAAVMTAMSGDRSEWPILTQLGWRGKGTPLTLLVSSGSLEEWLIALTGAHEEDIVRQLEPLLRGFSVGMERVRDREARRLRHAITDALVAHPHGCDIAALGKQLLAIVGHAVEATHGLLTVTSRPETLAATAGALWKVKADAAHAVREGYFTADALSLTLVLGGGRLASLELRRADGAAFRASHATAMLTVKPLITTWLSSIDAGDWAASFAASEAARVLRFGDPSYSSDWT
jgi:hypothetical protein